MAKKADNREFLSKLVFFSSAKHQLLEKLLGQSANLRNTTYIFTPNPEQLVEADRNPAFAQALQQADILLPDGMGVVLASKLLSKKGLVKPVKERITGVEVTADILQWAGANRKKVAIIGGRDYDRLLKKKYPQVHLVWSAGYANVQQPTQEEEQVLAAFLTAEKPDIVFVAFGAPWQELWVMEHRAVLATFNPAIVMVVGGSFDFLLGKVPRAPKLLQALGLEWFYRLLLQPWRWRRQLALITFTKKVLQEYFQA